MAYREIPEADWRRFLSEFTLGHKAWLTTVERVRGAGSRVEVSSRALGAIQPLIVGGRIVGIDIQFQHDSTAVPPVRVEAPVRLRLDETEEGRARALEIADVRGGCTRLRFRAAPPLEELDGVTPGEI